MKQDSEGLGLPDEVLQINEEIAIESLDERERIRQIAKRSTYFMGKAVLGYDLVRPRTHRAYCDFVDSNDTDPENAFIVTLMPRGTLKTTLGTVTKTLKDIANDPNIRILLASSTAKNSTTILKQIKSHFIANDRFRFLFSEIIHKDFNAKGLTWNQEEIQVPRTAVWGEPTIMAVGVGAEIVSRHFNRFRFDDLIGKSAMDSPAVMEDAISWLNYSLPLAVSQHDLKIHLNGTRYGAEDLYNHAINKMGFKSFIRKAIVLDPDGNPVPFFPEMHSMSFLENIIATDPFQWATQYANDPYDTVDSEFKPEWLQYYTIAPDGAIRFKDASGAVQRREIADLTTYIHVDPGGEGRDSDDNAIVVPALDSEGHVFNLHTSSFKGNALDLIDKIFELDHRFKPKLISIEAVAYQRHLKAFIDRKMREENRYLRIENYFPGTRMNKHTRIRRKLQPFGATGMIYVQARDIPFVHQWTHFSDRMNPNVLDAFAQGPDFWKTPLNARAREKLEKQTKALSINRGPTGYGI